MHLAYKDRVGGPWREYQHSTRNLFLKHTPIIEQYKELEHLGNVIIGTVRGNKITPRFSRNI